MPLKPASDEPPRQSPSAPVRNPYILNFCKVLVEKKGEQHPPDALKKLLHDMYRLFEAMLGQNMVRALPEDLRRKYLTLCEDLSRLNYETIGDIFDKNVPQYEQVMKSTMKQFAEIFMRNRVFNPKDYPVPLKDDSE
ncbi:MAG TPA: DUF5663 domain-containing protein [Syntrophobacteraceae bacterium]|nr:DUF5663 domain-containing protein [Syntrophobacteraceae bacterium]